MHSTTAIQWLVVLSGLSIYFSNSKERRRGRLRFILIGCLILATSTIDVVLDIWRAFRVSFLGGPSGRAYLEAGSEVWLENSKWLLVGDVMLCITIAAGDLLMVSEWTNSGFSTTPLTLVSTSCGAASHCGDTRNGF